MTRLSKKIITWFLGAIAFVAISFGVVFTIPQMNVAKAADTAVTFSAAYLEGPNGEKGDKYYQLRMDTQGQTWTQSYNNKKVSELPESVANYTTISGRTLTELQNACTSELPIIVTLQPAGTFSFMRIWIPLDFMAQDQIRSLGILDGWAFNDGLANYTCAETTYLRTGDTMVLASNYSATTKLTAEDITIGDATLAHRMYHDSNYTNRGADSYMVDITLGGNTCGEYDAMYDGYKYVRNAIYINGKSIDEWNTQMIAEDARFNDPATYTYFPQNSTTEGHKDRFAKPVGLWATSTGFRLSIFQELVANLETVEITIGTGCWKDAGFMVAERVSKTVLTQNVVDITQKLTFLDNSHNNPASWGETKLYFIHTNNETCWTAAPKGGCLNEYDPSNVGGGQIQMKYVTFNGSTLWDINKNDNGSYESTQGNIVNGGIYAPILVTMSGELGSSLKLTVPTAFTNGKSGHEEIVVKKGFNVKVGDTSYYVSRDVVFTNNDTTAWAKEIKAEEIATEVTAVITKANRTDGGNNENFVIFELSNNDYDGCSTTAITDISSLYGYIDIDGTMLESYSGEKFFNVWGIQNSVAFRAPGLSATDLQNVKYITIKAGAIFPSYATQNGAPLTYFVTQEDVTFVHDVPNDTWTVGEVPSEPEEPTETLNDTAVKGIETDGYTCIELTVSDYANADTDNDRYPNNCEWVSALLGSILYTNANGETLALTSVDDSWFEPGVLALDNAALVAAKVITINAGAKFPSHSTVIKGAATTYYVTTADITFYKQSDGTWSTTAPAKDITSEITFHHQDQQYAGTETYMFKTSNNYWTKAAMQGGCLNEYDAQGAGGGQEQLKYIYFNGTSLYDINKNDNGSYGSSQGNIASGGIYAPFLATLGSDNGNYSYIQIHLPTLYGGDGETADENHKTFELKAGLTITENGVTYTVTQDLKWVNLNGTWVNAANTFAANDVTIDNVRKDGVAQELYKVDITSNNFNITCNSFDFMYGHPYTEYRKSIFINGVSVYDINENTDDSEYVYSTSPMTGNDDALFAHPVLIYTTSDTITLWMHKNYIESLNGKITVTLGAGYSAFTNELYLAENVDYDLNVAVEIDDGTNTYTKYVMKNSTVAGLSLGTPSKSMTSTTMYAFEAWYDVETDTQLAGETVITEAMRLEARFTETAINLLETSIKAATYYINEETPTDRWFYFTLTNHDYPTEKATQDFDVEYIKSIGLLEKITLKGDISLGSVSVTEATLAQIGAANGYGEAVFMNIWNTTDYLGTIAFRVPGVNTITEAIVESGALFPSYEYVSGEAATLTYYAISKTVTLINNNEEGLKGVLLAEQKSLFDIQMESGASVRIASNMEKSGLRFQTNIAKTDLDALAAAVAEKTYTAVAFGTLIVPKDYLMGGLFTHEWLDKNGFNYLDIESTATLANINNWKVNEKNNDYLSFFGSIVKLKESNYNREFAGIGYIKLTKADGKVEYVYANYDAVNTRSASFVANAAINDRSETQTDVYENYIKDSNNYSPYTEAEHTFLATYITWSEESAVNTQTFELAKGASGTVASGVKLAGPYVELVYSTNVNVWGVFKYTDGNKTAEEDFYLQAGTTNHKQYLDIFRYNGVGYGMNTANLTMTSITFTNAELKECTGNVKVFGLYSQNKTVETGNQEIYVTVAQTDGSEMTVGAHLGLGGSLTYLAKSGIYEGRTSSLFGNVKISTSTSTFSGSNYYGNATSSKPLDYAVNLINNWDAGRQIQQSWYAEVGGSDDATNGENGYTRAYCYTESSSGKYWPYNPVQAGDVVSNPGQIIDYEVNEAKGYIYVKARAMDWAKGDTSCANSVEGGVTTKSYMENYYRLNADGTLVVNNSFVDWNGFTDMDRCGWASTELPAVYPVQTLNYYVSNTNGDGSWTDALEYNSGLASWTNVETSIRQNPDAETTKVEEWFAWANGGDGNAIGLGMYIPNVYSFTSGRGSTSIAYSTSGNKNANSNVLKEKGLMSNMQPIKYAYQSAYVSNTSYTAPGVRFRMEAYKPIEYSYVLCVNTVDNIRSTFKSIKDNGTITNAGNGYEKVGLDAWARQDKMWTW